MSNRVLIPKDVQSLINEIRPYLADGMKEIDVIRTVLVDFKLHRSPARDANGFTQTTRSKLQKAQQELDDDAGQEFENFEDITRHVQDRTQ